MYKDPIRLIFISLVVLCCCVYGCTSSQMKGLSSTSATDEIEVFSTDNTAFGSEEVEDKSIKSDVGVGETSGSEMQAHHANAGVASGTAEVQENCEPSYDFPVVINAQVEELLEYYSSGPGRRSFQLWLERSGKYISLMQQTFAEAGLPQDLVMLALVESGFTSNAHSWANAVGYWQFIESTGRMYGLENDWWRDERRDVEKATRAAAQYLSDLYRLFDGDWYLAVAAYNAGPGKMRNAIRRHDTRDFWQLAQGNYLRTETKLYIPKLIAAIIISKDPERYGFIQLNYAEPLEFDTVILSHPTDLEVVAELTGVDYSILKELNPELKRWCSPPGEGQYVLRVPLGVAHDFDQRYAAIPPQERIRYLRHELKAGENLALLAKRYNIRVDDIMDLNRIKDPRKLQIGQNLILPLHQEYSTIPVAELKDDYARSRRRNYTVRKGDSLWSIARKNSVTEKQLRVWNRLGWSDMLQPGQKLLVSAPSSRSKENSPIRQIVYKVRKGDTLWDIGKQYSIDAGAIRQWNNLAENHIIRPGDELTLMVASKLASGRS
ncbi:MAG: LysM peptidoglycan-binding domain-containing protein [Desulfuromonadaceae bacterium]|nr:LysM peptidoglycan-binding domain-containing protein [Desulfuromonadaceae bacterium]